MLKNPENYQEARQIIRNAVDDDLQTKRMKKNKIIGIVFVAAGIAVAIGVGIKHQDPGLGFMAALLSLVLTQPFTLGYRLMKYTKRRIENGDYFRDLPEDKIMDAAEDYVREYNKYEEKKRRREGV